MLHRPSRAASTAACALLVSLWSAGDLGAQMSQTSMALSQFVFATYERSANRQYNTSHTLLILWRGSARWFSSGGGGGSSAGGSVQTIRRGNHTFTLEFDHPRQIVKLYEREFSLKEVNVILVDQADSGPVVVGARWVDPPLDVDQGFGGYSVEAIIRRTPELFEYLKCDEVPDDLLGAAVMSKTCGRLRP